MPVGLLGKDGLLPMAVGKRKVALQPCRSCMDQVVTARAAPELPTTWHPALGVRGQVLAAGGTGVASVRSCWKLPPCPMEPMPAGSKMEPRADPAAMVGAPLG